jgi:streptogramin lyase
VLAAILASLAAAPAASAYIYWADSGGGKIGRSSNDGSGVDGAFVTTGVQPQSVAVDSGHVYWTNQGSDTIGRANIDGSGVDNGFITGLTDPSGVAVNGSSIFWSILGGKIGKASLDGTGKNANLVTGLVEPCGIALDAGHVYWVEISDGLPAYVARSDLNGSNKQLTYVAIPGPSFPCGVAVNPSNIFWTDLGFFGGGTNIGRANTNTGAGADASIIGDASSPCGAALSGSLLYWANAGTNTIGRANTDATAVNQSFVVTGGDTICGVAVDALAPPPVGPPAPGPAPDTTPPQTTIKAGPGNKLAQGKANFSFKSNEAGSRFECKLDAKKVTRCKSPRTYKRLKPGRHTFKVWAIDVAGNKAATPAKRRFRVPS